MKNSHLVITLLVALGVFAVVVARTNGEVNIAEVEGKFQEPDLKDVIENYKIHSAKISMIALESAYRAGYLQALVDYDIKKSTETVKPK